MSKRSIIGRVTQLARANINAMLDSAEDPERMLDSLLRDYAVNIAEAEQAIAQLAGSLRMVSTDQEQDADAIVQWSRQAESASQTADELRAVGDAAEADRFDSLARIALDRQLVAENDVRTVQHTIDAQDESVQKLGNGLEQMKAELSELQHKRNELVARPRGVRGPTQVTEATASIDVMDPASEMARFEAKVRREEARVRGHEELAASSLDGQFASLDDPENQAEIEERLQALKAGRAMASARARAQDQLSR